MVLPSRNSRVLPAVIAALLGFLLRSPAHAQNPTSDKVYSIIQRTLTALDAEGVTQENASRMDLQRRHGSEALQFDDRGRIGVVLDLHEFTPELIAHLQRLGGTIAASLPEARLVSAYLPIGQIDAAAAFPGVKIVRPMSGGIAHTGSQTSEGDTLHHAQAVRTDLGVNGDSMDVGVISDGCASWAVSKGSGDLPGAYVAANHTFSNGNKIGAGDEGTAMMEIVHDLAPGADIYFYGALGLGGGSPTMIDAIYKLGREKGCQIIVDDLTYFDQPMFEDGTPATAGTIAAAAQWAIDTGIVYISSAGNYARGGATDRSHYEAAYADGNLGSNIPGPKPLPTPVAPGVIQGFLAPFEDLHDFDASPGTDAALTVIRPPSTHLYVILEWNDPWGLSADDYDLYLYDKSLTVQKGASTTAQNGAQNPYEIVHISDYPWAETLNVIIDHVTAAGAPKLLGLYISGCSWVEYNTPEHSIWGQPGVPAVISVGAVPLTNTSVIENFSSRGPYDVYTPLYASRDKPDLVAMDGGVITGVGPFGRWDGVNWRFDGTSASAPQVAGMAALLRSQWPGLTPAQIHAKLERTAEERGTPGVDATFGHGLADAERAMLEVDTTAGLSGPYTMLPTTNVPMFFAAPSGYAIATVAVTGGAFPPTHVHTGVTVTGTNPYADAGVPDAETPTLGRWFQIGRTGGTDGQFDADITAYVAESERLAGGIEAPGLKILHMESGYYRALTPGAAPTRVGDTWKITGSYPHASFSPFFLGTLSRGIAVTDPQGAVGPPDSAVLVTFRIANTGTSFDSAMVQVWETRGWSIAPAESTFWLSTLDAAPEFAVRVDIAPGAEVGTIDTIWIRLRSGADSSLVDTAQATVTVRAKVATVTYAMAEGWNMISVPLEVADWRKTALFPGAVSPAYTYEHLYVAKDSLTHCVGYWVKFDSAREVAASGSPCTEDSVAVIGGWNMIGSIAAPIAVAAIASSPPGIAVSNFFTYDGTSYLIADSVKPGIGYWVKASQQGELFLSSPGAAPSNRVRIIADEERPPLPPHGGAAGGRQSLVPDRFDLRQNYPNPFNPSTVIGIDLPRAAFVTLKVFTVLGTEVATLIQGPRDAGRYEVRFEAGELPSGLYLYRLESDGFEATRKFLLVR